MATVQYESKDNTGRKFWTGRYGRYAVWIDANRPGVNRWLITVRTAQSASGPMTPLPSPPDADRAAGWNRIDAVKLAS